MEGEYRFKNNECPSCGCVLTETSSVVGFYRDVIPMGACPKCGEHLRLDASPEDSKVTLNYEVVVKTGADASAPVKLPTSHKAKASTHPNRWPGVGQQYGAEVKSSIPTEPEVVAPEEKAEATATKKKKGKSKEK